MPSNPNVSTSALAVPRRVTPLPDHLGPGLHVLFVGINPGLRSARIGHHYAGRGNRFWKLMHESGLLPERLSAERDTEVLRWGYGLTNIVARPTSGVAGLGPSDFESGRNALLRKIRAIQPAIVALVGLTVYDRLRGAARRPRAAEPRLGLKRERLHGARLFVLPNPSGRNTHFTYVEMLRVYRRLARLVAQRAPTTRRPKPAQRSAERTILPR